VFPAELFRMEGDPAAIRASAAAWSGFGGAATAASGRILGLDTSQFIGPEGDLFRSNLTTEPPPHLRLTGDAFGRSATALSTFAATLAGLQDQMRPLTARAPVLWQQLQIAIARAAAGDPGAHAQLIAARMRWDQCVAEATALRSAMTAAVETAAAAVDGAAGMAFTESVTGGGLVAQGKSFVRDHAEGLRTLSGVLKGVSLVAGVLSFVPVLAPIAAPIAVGTGLAATAVDASLYASTGEGDATTIAVDAGLNLLPGVGRLGRPLAEALGAARPALSNALRTTGDIRSAVAAKAPQLFSRVKRALGFDPIDLVSGEMVLPQTDVELPGLLPLMLRRTHLSSYRVGGWFGRSWASTLDQRVEVDEAGACYAAADGMLLVYPPPSGGAVLPAEGPRLPLARPTEDTYTVTDPDLGQTLHFGPGRAHGRITAYPLAAVTDRNGHRIEVRRDAAGAPVELGHSGGYRIAVTTDRGRVTALRLRGRDGRLDQEIVRYGYDARGDLVEVVNSSGRPLRFDYDPVGRITRWEDRNGEWYGYGYDIAGRVVRTDGSGGCLTGRIAYDPTAGVTAATDSLGHTTTYHASPAMQVERVVDPLGHARTHDWDRYGRPLAETDELGRTTRYDYDDAGRLVRVTGPDGAESTVDRDRLGLPVRSAGPDGAVWRREYDDAGNLLAEIDPAGATTRYGYAPGGHLRSVADAFGRVSRVDTDAAGLPVAVTDPTGRTTTYERDDFGRVVAVTDPLGRRTGLEWTIEGRLVARTGPDGGTERWAYDGEGNLVEHTAPDGVVTWHEPTHFDLPGARVDADGARTEFGYDTELRLAAVTNPLGEVWRYEYDAAGRLVRETDFAGRVLSYGHDAAGQVVRRTNGVGETVELGWDAGGRLVRRASADDVATFEYDAAGRLVRATNADADVRVERDALGRIVAETCDGRAVASAYDALGRRVSRRTPSGAESRWEYGPDDLPVALHTGGHTLRFRYDAGGREVERRVDGALALTQRWDSASRLLAQTVAVAGADPVQQRAFAYRSDDVVERIEDRLRGVRRFELDGPGRVTAVHGEGWSERYAYDAAGRPIGPRGARYVHDAQGRVVLRQRKSLSGKPRTWRFRWNAEDRLVAVRTPEGQDWRYRYDALGRRIAKQRLGPDGTVAEQVDFSWDGDVLAEQTSAERELRWDWAPGQFRPLTQTAVRRDLSQEEVDERFHAIVTDLVGTPTELVRPDGTVDWQPRTALWGATAGAQECPLRFPGQYADPETGLHYNYHRYYDPQTASYASPDPLGLGGGPDPHAYVPNPLTWLDPLGLAACKPVPEFVYRGGSRQPANMTPRPGKDPTGLSTFDTPELAVGGGPGKAQKIDVSKLSRVKAHPDDVPPGHVSLQPSDLTEIPGWAATRGTDKVHPYTQEILDAIVDEVRVPKPGGMP
jgi:RHS repeat-associated protein